MSSSRRSWFVASVLLLLGALAGGGAVREHWSACRGSMLSGSVLRAYTYGTDFSEACLEKMDSGGFAFVWLDGKDPWGTESLLGVTCALLWALSWGVVVVAASWSRGTRVMAGVPAVLTAGAAVANFSSVSSDSLDVGFDFFLLAVNVSAVVAFVVIAAREQLSGWTLARVAFVLAGSTAVGELQLIMDYLFMVTIFSDANWDVPPGAGYPTVVAVGLLGAAVLLMTVSSPARPRSRADRLVHSDLRA